ncbi:unnamed protein product [Paramecium pentaurelia]|uniref:Protein kinase domain-containing protein n=1 Tax=Paramecium pentaurelia TaxID=43138 RepID=A0A8S1SH37_9CILI|nr:unnamed protein product [Paramecium pentaurelia]
MSEESDQYIEEQDLHIELLKAIKENNIQQIKNLLYQAKQGNNDLINFQIKHQPIHLAVWIGNMKIMLLLIQNGANVDAISNTQMNCLTIAVYRKHVNLVQALLAIIKDPNFLSKRGTALHIAALQDDEQIMELLLKHPNIDINIKFKNETPIQVAGQMTRKLLLVQERLQKSSILITNSFINSDSHLFNQFQLPALITGFSQEIDWYGMRKSRKFLLLDPINGIFAKFQRKVDYPLKPQGIMALELINSVQINNNLCFSTPNYSYLEIKYSNNKTIWYSFRSKNIAKIWKDKIQEATQYFQHLNQKYMVFYQQNDSKRVKQYFFYEMELKQKIEQIELEDTNFLFEGINKDSQNYVYNDHQNNYQQKSKKLSDFQILKCIGKGSFGYVFMVEYQKNTYALKQQDKQRLKQSNNLEYVMTEVKILRMINHPFIVKYIMSFQTTKNLYLVLEILQQGDLAMYMTRGIILDEKLSKLLIGQIILAIEHLHKHDILYRDLKPENICVDSQGYIKLIDFGLCKFITQDELTFTICGSPAYLAPEVLNNSGISKSTDVYQIGLLLYEMLTGYPPFYTRDINILIKRIKTEQITIPNNISKEARDLLSQILKQSAFERISIEQIKQHNFFKDLDWLQLEKKEIKIPQLIQRFQQSKRATGDLIDSDSCLDDYIQDWDFSTI